MVHWPVYPSFSGADVFPSGSFLVASANALVGSGVDADAVFDRCWAISTDAEGGRLEANGARSSAVAIYQRHFPRRYYMGRALVGGKVAPLL